MKRIHIYILTAMALLNSSCSADWLDLNTTSSVETGQAIVTLDDAQIALNGIYRLASGHSYYGDNYWYYGDCRAADVQARITKGDGKRVSPYYEYNVLASDNLNIVLPWNTVYKVIRQTNNLIQKIESGSIQSSDTKELNRIKSEALVIRGLSLFNLTRLFGMPYTNDKGASLGVPIETSPSNPTHKPSRSTVAQCYEQVVSDMSNALSGLKQETSNGYINYWAAQALLSRVYLNMGEYQKAYDAATDVIKNNGGRYQLYSYEEYPNVWRQDFQSESLFELYITLSEPSGGTGGEGAPMVYANEATVDWNNLILSEDFLNLLNEDSKDVRPYKLSYKFSLTSLFISLSNKLSRVGFWDNWLTIYSLNLSAYLSPIPSISELYTFSLISFLISSFNSRSSLYVSAILDLISVFT